MDPVCEHGEYKASGLLTPARNITHLPFPPEVNLLIYECYIDLPLPGTRAYTDLLCLNRSTFAKKISGLYVDVVLSSKNVEAFFQPWKEWFAMISRLPDSWDLPSSGPSDTCPIRPFLVGAFIRHLTFSDTTSLTTTLEFYQFWKTHIWHRPLMRSLRASPGKIFHGLSSVSFLAPALRQSPSDRRLWPTFGSLPAGLWRWVCTSSVSLQMPKEGLDGAIVGPMSEFIKWQERSGFELIVLDYAMPHGLPWVSNEGRISVEYRTKGKDHGDRLGDEGIMAHSKVSPRGASRLLKGFAERNLSSLPNISSSML
ncbi:hypothetical protein IAR50_006251 [Cryptococcus sp. DSM 104548]